MNDIARHFQEMLNTPHEDYDEVFHRVCRIDEFLAEERLHAQLRAWFGARSLGQILEACRTIV